MRALPVRQLTPQQVRFAEEFISDPRLDPRAAAVRAGFKPNDGRRLLANPLVQDRISLLKSRALSRCEIYGDAILRTWAALAGADPAELQYAFRVNCRRCWGIEHQHQFTDAEHQLALRNHLREQLRLPEAERREFDDLGGPGFMPFRDPMRGPDWVERERATWPVGRPFDALATSDRSCPACGGYGELKVVLRDTRSLSPAGRLLFDGYKVHPGGQVEIRMRDRFRAEENLARFAGLFNDRRQIDEFDPDRLTDEQLNEVLGRLVERGAVELEGEAVPVDDESEREDVE